MKITKPTQIKLTQIREYLMTIGDRQFKTGDLPIAKGIQALMKIMVAECEVAQVAYQKGWVYEVVKLKTAEAPPAVFTRASPYPHHPFLPGYVVLSRRLVSQGVGG